MKYKRKYGYYKYYNKDGKKCRIKFLDNFQVHERPFQILVKFKLPGDDEFAYHSPNKTFYGVQDIIHYILSNLENDGVIFEISRTKV